MLRVRGSGRALGTAFVKCHLKPGLEHRDTGQGSTSTLHRNAGAGLK
jgi:hypothetical protein